MSDFVSFLKQPSTLRGIIGLLGVLGVVVSPEQIEAIAVAVGAILAAIEIFRNENKNKPKPMH